MKRLTVLLCAMVLMFGVAGNATAALWDRGGGLIYDDVLDITWLQDANYAATELTATRLDEIISAVGSVDGHTLTADDFYISGGEYPGRMSWWGALAWTYSLECYDPVRGVTWTDWRLPTTPGTQWGYLNEGEIGHLYYEDNITTSTPGLFTNLQPYYYWSGTECNANPADA